MVMNNRGQVALLALAVGFMIFFVGMTLIDPLKEVITDARAADQLDCGNSSISDGQKATCLVVDMTLPYYLAIVFGVAGALITARWIA